MSKIHSYITLTDELRNENTNLKSLLNEQNGTIAKFAEILRAVSPEENLKDLLKGWMNEAAFTKERTNQLEK